MKLLCGKCHSKVMIDKELDSGKIVIFAHCFKCGTQETLAILDADIKVVNYLDVLWWRVVEGKEISDIGKLFGLPPKQIRDILSRLGGDVLKPEGSFSSRMAMFSGIVMQYLKSFYNVDPVLSIWSRLRTIAMSQYDIVKRLEKGRKNEKT